MRLYLEIDVWFGNFIYFRNVLAILEVMFEHLERLMKYLSSKQVFEGQDSCDFD